MHSAMKMEDTPQLPATDDQSASTHWIAILIIGLVFFCTTHDLLCTRDYVNSAKGLFAPTDQPAIQLICGWEPGRETSIIAYALLGSLGILGFTRIGRNRFQFNGMLALAIVFYVAWASASLLWSLNVGQTAKHVYILAMMLLALSHVVRRFSNRDVLILVAVVTGAYVLIGLCAEISLGSMVLGVKGYRFSGTNHPIATSVECAMLCITAMYLRRNSRFKPFFLALAGVGFVCLLLTHSRTSFYGMLLAPLVFRGWTFPRSPRAMLALSVLAAVCFAVLLAGVIRPVLHEGAKIGHVDSHDHQEKKWEGRADLWSEVVSGYAINSPLLGTGYNSFWSTVHIEDVAKETRFRMFTTRSAFVELLLGVGLIGMIAYVIVYLAGIHRCAAYYRATRDSAYFFFGSILVFALLHSVMESVFVFGSATTFMAMAVLAKLGFEMPPEAYTESLAPARLPATVPVSRGGRNTA